MNTGLYYNSFYRQHLENGTNCLQKLDNYQLSTLSNIFWATTSKKYPNIIIMERVKPDIAYTFTHWM